MRNWLAVGVVVFGAASSLATGCSSNAGPATVAAYCQQRAEAECNTAVVSLCEVQQSACISTRTQSCMSYATSSDVTNGSRVFNPNNVAACIAVINSAYGNLSSTDTVIAYNQFVGEPGDTSTVDYICDSVFQGEIHNMGSCTSDFDCADSNNVCTPANGGAKALICAPAIQVQDGQSCGGAGDVCPAQDVCKGPTSQGEYLCEASTAQLGGQGATCKTDADCDPGVAGFCDIYNSSGTCQPNLEFATKDCQLYGQAK